MSIVSQRIKMRREQLDMSLKDLACTLGYSSKSAIWHIENPEKTADGYKDRDIQISKLEMFAKALNTTVAYLMGWVDNPELTAQEILLQKQEHDKQHDSIINVAQLPILGKIACGEPIYAPEAADTYIMSNTNLKADFALIADGDSMIGENIFDGDIVLIKAQPEVNNGEIAAVSINDEHTLKKVFYNKEENQIILAPANSKYQPMIYSDAKLNDVRILGKAVAVQHILN